MGLKKDTLGDKFVKFLESQGITVVDMTNYASKGKKKTS